MSSEVPNPYGSDYKWPADLYTEMIDMGALSFFCYEFAHIADVARKVKKNGENLKGLIIDETSGQVSKSEETEADLKRSFTPSEVKSIIEENQKVLEDHYPSEFNDTTYLMKTLDRMEERAKESENSVSRPLTLEEFDDRNQNKELVYAITKDSVNKRLTVVFRGSDNLAFASNWKTNANILKTTEPVPDCMKDKIPLKTISVHRGFYNYVFAKTADESDAADITKYNEIVSDLKVLLKKYPDHKVYVTGHSLGAALSTLTAFYLACEEDIPKPVSCVNFASPRVGNADFLSAVQYLEKTKKLRVLRSVNENDLVTVMPSIGFQHVGFQVTAFHKGRFCKLHDPEINYPRYNMGFSEWCKVAWSNSVFTNLNPRYDHGDYIKRILSNEKFLRTKNLNSMYADPKLVGFTLK